MARIVISLWPLLGIGLAGLAALSVFVGLAIGAILGQISRAVSQLLEFEPSAVPGWTTDRRTLSAPRPAWGPSSSARPAKRA